MTVKELNRFQKLKNAVESLKIQIREVEAKATNTASTLSDMPHVIGKSDKVGDNAVILAELKKSLQRIKEKHEKELKRLLAYIEGVEDAQVQQIMLYRFVHGKTWVQVAFKIGGGNTADGIRMMVQHYLKKAEKTREPRT